MVVQSEMVDVAQQSGVSGWWAGDGSQFPAALLLPADSSIVWVMAPEVLPLY